MSAAILRASSCTFTRAPAPAGALPRLALALSISLSGAAGCGPRPASLGAAADLSDALAQVLDRRRADLDELARASLRARVERCERLGGEGCVGRATGEVFAELAPAQQRHDELVMLQRAIADAIEQASSCAARGEPRCEQERLEALQRDVGRLVAALRAGGGR